MNGDWRMRLLKIQGVLFLVFAVVMTALYRTRPHYAPGPEYALAHDQYDLILDIVAGAFLAISLGVTASFRFRSARPPRA